MTLRAPGTEPGRGGSRRGSVDPVRVQIGAAEGEAQPYLLTVELAEGPAPDQVAEPASSAIGPDADHRRAAQSEWEPERHSPSATPRPYTSPSSTTGFDDLRKPALAGCHDFALLMVEALENDELVHEAPAIVGRQTPSALAQAASE
jgi:hypothetical protein